MKRAKGYPHWVHPTKKEWLRAKRAEGKRLLKAMEQFRLGCAFLPPAEDCNGGALLSELERWIKGPCRDAWRRA
jgi:hypothetical protein